MIRCPNCRETSSLLTLACPFCGHSPALKGGFPSFVTHEGAGPSQGFSADFFRQLAPLEAENFWFVARNRLILRALEQHGRGIQSFTEIGCGTGFVLEAIHQHFPDWALLGSELFTEGLEVAAERLPGISLIQLDARDMPFESAFEAVGLFDVLEHIEEDDRVLAMIHRALRPDGLLLLTVPQHPWLWSRQDVEAFHVRRYTRQGLEAQLKATGFSVIECTAFVSLLLPMMLLSRRLARRTQDPQAELRLSFGLNRLFGWVMGLERWLIQRGLRFPIGGSLLVVARRQDL